MPFKDPEEKKACDRAYREANGALIAERDRARYQANKALILEKQRAYNQSPAGHKASAKNSWKQSGLIHDDYNALYDSYLQRTHCDVCKSEFKDSFDRCMDHDHSTGLFRQFLCRSCNNNDAWLKH